MLQHEYNDVPETGFEPARRFQRYHLKVVRLPISPPGLKKSKVKIKKSKVLRAEDFIN